MTLYELFYNTNLQCTILVQELENDVPITLFEGEVDGGFPEELTEHEDRVINYIFPYTFYHGRVLIGGICIELEELEE